MIEITFKEVGQGDSIIISWTKDKINCCGIIDCCLSKNKSNPTLEHIIRNNISEVGFIILSHPHFDHFSGLYDILDFIEKSDIKLHRFLFTINDSTLLNSFVYSQTAQNELSKLLMKVEKISKNGVEVGFIQGGLNKDIILDEHWKLVFLSPTFQEYSRYQKLEKRRVHHGLIQKLSNNPNANLLCTIICLKNDNSYVLLTSDATISALLRAGKNDGILNSDLKMILGQIPHHGAKTNHIPSFWDHRNYSTEKSVVVSVGENSYDHPDEKTISYFNLNKFIIYSTNYVGGLKKKNYYKNYLISSQQTSDVLDFFSEIKLESSNDNIYSRLNGDKHFQYK